jgi:hypothetical protein
MNAIKNSKLSRVVSTKITDEEHKLLGIMAKDLQSRGYIAKAKTSEALRYLLRDSMNPTDQITTQTIVSESRNPVTALGKSSTSALDKTVSVSRDSTISRGNISSPDSVQQSTDMVGNSIGILAPDAPKANCKMPQAQKLTGGSTNAEIKARNTFGSPNNVGRPDLKVSQVDKNLTDGGSPSLEFMGKYLEYLRQIPGMDRYCRYLAPKLAL